MKDQQVIRDLTRGTFVETDPHPSVKPDPQPGIRLGATKTCGNCGCANPNLSPRCRNCGGTLS